MLLTRWLAAVSAYAVAGLLVSGSSACSRAGLADHPGPPEVTGVTPVGSANSLDFSWDVNVPAARYHLTIRDAGGTVVFSGESTERSMNIDASARSRFATMVDYSWTVRALNAAGETIAQSTPRSFTYQP